MKLSGIFIYPVKSLGGIEKARALMKEKGLDSDRRFMIVDLKGNCITQREQPALAAIRVEDERERFVFRSGDSVRPLFVAKSHEPVIAGQQRSVRIWRDRCDAEAVTGGATEWFTQLLGIDCELVRMPPASRRLIDAGSRKLDEAVSFADAYPVLIISEASLRELNKRLIDPVEMNRFRPNLVVSGSDPFAEDAWKRVRIGKTVFRSTRPCARCVVTTVDQQLGVFSGKEPLKTLATFRRAGDVMPDGYKRFALRRNDVLFGQNFVPENPGTVISIGSDIKVIETCD